VILVADAYDAMTTDRSYREAALPQDALVELRGQAGVQFDPTVVAALAAHLEDIGLVSPLELGELVLLDRQVA
jgi:HD-GYP domain-containing protein (c-di-GMP phosphodiesterase class II)